jgi:DNA-binding transcriptional LysR family regulator
VHSDHLLAFESIVREGSFGKAARALGISQPSISARVRALEREVGGVLLDRSRRGVSLTEQGRAFLPYARRVLEVMDEGLEASREVWEGRRGRVTVGVPESLAGGFVASAISRFRSSHPEAEVFAKTGHSDQVVEMLHDGVAKLGLITGSYLDDGLTTVLRFREPLVTVTHPDHPLAARKDIPFAEVVQKAAPFFLVRWSPAFAAKVEGVAHGAFGARTMMEVPVSTARELLLSGVGASLLTRSLAERDLASGRLVELGVADPPRSNRESALVRLVGNGATPKVVSAFVDSLRLEAEKACVRLTDGLSSP